MDVGEEPIVVAVLECASCGERTHSAIVPRRPDLTPRCPTCGETMTLVDLIVGD